MPYSHAADAAHQEILPCATFAPDSHCIHTVWNPVNAERSGMRTPNSQCATLYQLLTNTAERIPSIRHVGGLSCRLAVLSYAKSTRDKNTQETTFRHAMCALFAPSRAVTVSCPLLVAHAPHKVAGVLRAGIFLSLQGNDMAKCQRTKLDTARSLHSAFCSVGNVILRAMYDLSSSTGSQ